MTPRAKRRIMVIGFDENFCYLMQRYGRISACKLAFANQEEDILAQVQKNQPGVIFLEVAHPISFAWNLFKELKANQDTCHIPVVVCSWQGEDTNGEHESGDYYLRLPILYEHFKSALDNV
jgi:response regulator RpfG family c-di-GMP phosphodiesterase